MKEQGELKAIAKLLHGRIGPSMGFERTWSKMPKADKETWLRHAQAIIDAGYTRTVGIDEGEIRTILLRVWQTALTVARMYEKAENRTAHRDSSIKYFTEELSNHFATEKPMIKEGWDGKIEEAFDDFENENTTFSMMKGEIYNILRTETKEIEK